METAGEFHNECIVRGIVSTGHIEQFLLKLESFSYPHLTRCVFLSKELDYSPATSNRTFYTSDDQILCVEALNYGLFSESSVRKELEAVPLSK
jgi:hypothetical protein